jgi:hypothetical protein
MYSEDLLKNNNINSVMPIKRYDYIVEDILRDKKYNSSLDYYNNTTQASSYDILIAKTKMKIDQIQSNIVDSKSYIDKSREVIEKNNKKTDVKELNKKIEESMDQICELENCIKKTKQELKDYELFQYIELNEEAHLRNIRNKFMIDNNLEYLKKAVTWICSYSDRMRGEPFIDSNKN